MYTIISIVCLCLEVLLIGFLGYLAFTGKAVVDKKNLLYLIPVFAVIYTLYLTATLYNGGGVSFYTVFLLIHQTLSMVSMELNEELVGTLSGDNPWFFAATIGACILSLLTVVLSVCALFGVVIGNEIKKRKNFISGGDIVVGVSPSSLEYLETHENAVLWVEKIDKDTYLDLIRKKYVVHRAPLNSKRVAKCLRGREYHLIVFRDAGYSYSSILKCFEALKSRKDKHLFLHLEANANEMDIMHEKILPEMSKNLNTYVLPFCRYELMARRFMVDYPITKYVPRDFYNDNLTLKDEKEINVVFLGFGKVNYELFKMMVTNFQFAKQKDGKLYSSPVHYYTFDNNEERFNNEHFIKIINEYDQVFKGSDLEAAENICDLKKPQPMDAHSAATRQQIRELVNDNTYTYFIVSISDDYGDAAFARDLNMLLEGEKNYKIFVRSKGDEGCMMHKGEDNIICFGENSKCFLHENIVNDDLMQLSRRINDLHSTYNYDKYRDLRAWQNLPVVEQYSNVSAAVNVYFKLHMMGLDIVKETDKGMTKKALEAAYPDAFMSRNEKDYNYFFGTKMANVLAYVEHSRWNAYYILSGYKPLKFEEFVWKTDDNDCFVLQHKDISRLRHACLTTYRGLDKLIKYKCRVYEEEAKKGEKKLDKHNLDTESSIYRYDYMVIDNIHDAMERMGYSIVKK